MLRNPEEMDQTTAIVGTFFTRAPLLYTQFLRSLIKEELKFEMDLHFGVFQLGNGKQIPHPMNWGNSGFNLLSLVFFLYSDIQGKERKPYLEHPLRDKMVFLKCVSQTNSFTSLWKSS